MDRDIPLPPDELIELVVGHTNREAFDTSRTKAVDRLLEFLSEAGVDFSKFENILDMGCGCGRILAGWAMKGFKYNLYGCDINQKLVSWCNENLAFIPCKTVDLHPPSDYQSNLFDFVYCISVFTHLRLGNQRNWVFELLRILRPGGYLFITFHGKKYHETFFKKAPGAEKLLMEQGYLIFDEYGEGSNVCAVLHDADFFFELLKPFKLIKHFPGPTYIAGEQDGCIFQKEGSYVDHNLVRDLMVELAKKDSEIRSLRVPTHPKGIAPEANVRPHPLKRLVTSLVSEGPVATWRKIRSRVRR